jgi:hypothetical protein
MNAGMNPFNMNMLGMVNLSAMSIPPEAQLLASQIAAAGGGFGKANLAGLGGLGGFGECRAALVGITVSADRAGPETARPATAKADHHPQGTAKKDEDDFDPVVLNDVAGWLRTLRLHKYTPNFEGMSWKDMVVMDAQGVAGARRKMLKTFEVVRRKMGIDDPTAPPPPPPPSCGQAPSSASTLGSSAGSGGWMPLA